MGKKNTKKVGLFSLKRMKNKEVECAHERA